MASSKRVAKETVSTVIGENGEVLKESTEMEYRYIEAEPEFVKLYTGDLLKLKNIPNASNSVLLSIIRRIGYDNQVGLFAPIKRQIADELGVSLKKVEQAIQEFAQKDILIRKDRGLYVINPNFFGKGKWTDIKRLRLQIEYSASGKAFLKTQINEEKDSQLAINYRESKISVA